jgi:hypothetical protein
MTLSTLWSVWPSLLVTVYDTGGAWPVKPGAGVKVVVPLGITVMVPVVAPDTGSLTVTGVDPAGYTTDEPGSVKLVMVAVSPGGGVVLSSRLSVSGPLPCTMVRASLASVTGGSTVMSRGTTTDWPSELVTVACTVGTGPV